MTYDEIITYVSLGLSVLLAVINCLTRGRYKNILKEIESMIQYRTADYRTNPDEVDKGTTFSHLVPRFRLNKASGLLEPDEPIDVTALANSARDVELKALLAKLEQGTAELTESIKTQYNDYTDTLDRLADAMDLAEECRERFGMSADDSLESIIARIDSERAKLDKDLQTIKNSEVNANAQESEQAEKPQNV